MIKWAGYLITFYGAAHTLGALTFEKAAQHAGTWFSGGLWHEQFTAMSPAHSAYWFSLGSFGIPLLLLGLTIVWLARRGITPPRFLGWTLIIWNIIDSLVLILTPWPLFLLAGILLVIGTQRAARPITAA